jgi:hypothetical protein
MRIDFTPPDGPARRAKVWAASMTLVFTAVAAVVIAWVLALSYLEPILGFGAVVAVAAFAGALSFGVGRVIEWLVRG